MLMMSSVMEVAAVTETPENVQRWTAKRRSALVLSIIKGETSVAEAARKHGLTVAEVELEDSTPARRDVQPGERRPCRQGESWSRWITSPSLVHT